MANDHRGRTLGGAASLTAKAQGGVEVEVIRGTSFAKGDKAACVRFGVLIGENGELGGSPRRGRVGPGSIQITTQLPVAGWLLIGASPRTPTESAMLAQRPRVPEMASIALHPDHQC